MPYATLPSTHGVMNVNPIDDYEFADESHWLDVDHTDERLVEVNRVRYLSDRGFPVWELSYCYGRLADGTHVRVHVPEGAYRLPKRKTATALIAAWPRLVDIVPKGYVLGVLSLCQ